MVEIVIHDAVSSPVRRAGFVGIALAIAVVLGGCTGAVPAEETDAGIQPVIARDFPDPDVLVHDGVYYAYATNSAFANVQVSTSEDLQHWTALDDDGMPELPPWTRVGDTWAPEVTAMEDGTFRLYFTAANLEPELQCIGVATADSPEGPFTAVGSGMLVCPEDAGGAIDASTFRADDGALFLVWKNDGNCCGLPASIHLTPLSADGLALAGPDRVLISNDLRWERDVVEAPTLIERDDRFHLFYSASFYGDDSYSIGHASAESVDGPWEKDPTPLVSSESTDYQIVGPGGQDVVTDADGEQHLVLHGWDDLLQTRSMYVLPLEWEGDTPVVRVPPRPAD